MRLNVDELLNLIYTTGGFSASFETGEAPTTGFMVGLERFTRIIPLSSPGLRDELEAFIRDRSGKVTDAAYLGAWVDNDLVWLDVSVNIPDFEDALAFARNQNQVAIWEVDRGVINVNNPRRW